MQLALARIAGSRSRTIDAARIGNVLGAAVPIQTPYRAVHVGAHAASDSKLPVRYRCRIRLREQSASRSQPDSLQSCLTRKSHADRCPR